MLKEISIAESSESIDKSSFDKAGNREALALWRNVTLHSISEYDFDLSCRQMGILLMIYTKDDKHTVRGLASDLHISKPAVTRALDRLTSHKLIKRVRDQEDRRNVFITPTQEGYLYLSRFSETILESLSEVN